MHIYGDLLRMPKASNADVIWLGKKKNQVRNFVKVDVNST